MPRKIIIDCDPGHDDAMAILLAHGNPEIELCAIAPANPSRPWVDTYVLKSQ